MNTSDERVAEKTALRFNAVFMALVAIAFLGGLAAMSALKTMHILPAPPLTATYCIDEKLDWLSGQDLADADMIAVGSSATWRNLDMQPFVDKGIAARPVNAAPCFLRINQTAFYAGYLLDHMPQVHTVITVISPRDFEQCVEDPTEFFDTGSADLMLFDGITPWWLYVSNFKPRTFTEDVLRLNNMRRRRTVPDVLTNDRFGSSPQFFQLDWLQDVSLQDDCYSGLTQLEAETRAHDARLIVVTAPVSPVWSRAYDDKGAKVARWTQGVGNAIQDSSTILVRGDRLAYGSGQFSDYVHLLGPYVMPFSTEVADTASRRVAALDVK